MSTTRNCARRGRRRHDVQGQRTPSADSAVMMIQDSDDDEVLVTEVRGIPGYKARTVITNDAYQDDEQYAGQ